MSTAISESDKSAFPILGWVKGYRKEWLRWDVIAALTTWALVVPQAIAYGQIAGLPAQAGIFTAFAGLVVYALLGGSRQMIVTPMSAIAAISASTVAPLAFGDMGRYAALSATLAILTGILMIVFGILKLGFISQFIAQSVQVGLMFGLGMTIVVTQLPKILGIPDAEGTFFEQIANILANIGAVNAWTVVVGVVSFAALFLLARLRPSLPAALLVVVVSLLVVTLLNLPERGVDVLGHVERQLPLPKIPDIDWGDIGTLLAAAFGMALIMYAESDTVSEQFATAHRYDVKPNQEMIALGASNIAAGLFQGFVTGGGASQSAANDRAGAKTQLSGLLVAGLVFLTSVALMPLFTNLAQAVLAAIVINAVLGFINVKAIRHLWELRRDSFWFAMVALVGVLVLGMLPGLIVAVIVSIALSMARSAQPALEELGRLPGGEVGVLAEHPEAIALPKDLLVVRLESSLNAANVKHVRREVQALATQRDAKVVVLDLELTNNLDVESVDVLELLNSDLRFAARELWLSRVHHRILPMLEKSGLAAAIGEEHIFDRTRRALDFWQVSTEVELRSSADIQHSKEEDMIAPNDVRKREFFSERDIEVDPPLPQVESVVSPEQPHYLRTPNEERKREFFSERDISVDGDMEVTPPVLPGPPLPAPDLPAPDYPAPDWPISPPPAPERPPDDIPRPEQPGTDEPPKPMPDPNEPKREFPPL